MRGSKNVRQARQLVSIFLRGALNGAAKAACPNSRDENGRFQGCFLKKPPR